MTTQRQIDNYIGTKEASEILGVTPMRVQQLAQEGRLPHLTTALGRLFARQEVVAIAATRATQKAVKRAA